MGLTFVFILGDLTRNSPYSFINLIRLLTNEGRDINVGTTSRFDVTTKSTRRR